MSIGPNIPNNQNPPFQQQGNVGNQGNITGSGSLLPSETIAQTLGQPLGAGLITTSELAPALVQLISAGQPLSQAEFQLFLRQLLKLPGQFPLLMAWLGEGQTPQKKSLQPQLLQQLLGQLTSNNLPNLTPESLSKLLLPTIQQANQQLAKLLTQPHLAPQQREQLQQALNVISQLSQTLQQQPQQVLQTFLALYLPLHPNTPIDAWLEKATDMDSDDNTDSDDEVNALVIAITVPNIGVFKIQLFSSKTLVVTLAETFNDQDAIHRRWMTLTNESKLSPRPEVSFRKQSPSETSNSKDISTSSPRIDIFPEGGISPTILTYGYTMAKAILQVTAS